MSAVVDAVKEAYQQRRPARVVAGGTWLEGGRPVAASGSISVKNEIGIVEYVPGDLTLTARAGTRLADIASATRANDQWLPLEPWSGDDGTLGATVSTATAGPFSHALGLPRDTVLGLEFVSGLGEVIRCGGRVVKNVAGFDLTRLLVGSWGTLGIITEISVRLRARPLRARSIALRLSDADVSDLFERLRALSFTPLVCELLNAALARRLGIGSRTTLLVQVGGNERSVAAQLDHLRKLGVAEELNGDVVAKLRTTATGAAGWRWSGLPSEFGATWRAMMRIARDDTALVHGNPLRGVVRCVSAGGERTPTVREIMSFDGTTVVEALPASAWPSASASMGNAEIERAVRTKFDPAGIMNPGILGAS